MNNIQKVSYWRAIDICDTINEVSQPNDIILIRRRLGGRA